MSNIRSLFLGALVTAITGAVTVPVFNADANSNMAVYWGQGPNQQRLAHFCADTKIDIIPIGFVNQFPDQTGGYPGSNFGNQCADTYYTNTDGSTSKLLNSCPDIGPDIKACQALGKKILLSLGGAIPNNQHITSSASATSFATFLWRSFGPDKEASGSTFPRPFGDAAVDGFDFDIENALASQENSQDLYYGYSTMISSLRGFYAKEPRPYYISGAPQCVVPDAHLANAIQYSHFDFLFVQFYNTAQCSARAYFDHTYGAYGGPATNISFDAWVAFVQNYSNNKAVKVFLGLPASSSNQIVTDSKMYLQPAEAQEIISAFQCKYPTVFGGVMLYEATASDTNSINGKPYADVLKGYLTSDDCAGKRTSSSIVSLPTATSTVPKELRTTDDASCSKASCYSTLVNTADVPDPTEFCDFNQLLGGIPLPGVPLQDCGVADVSSACSCLTVAPTTTSSSSSSSLSATSTAASSSPSSYKRPSGSPVVSFNSTSSRVGSGTASYSRSTGTAPYSRSSGTAPYSRSSGTAPYSRSTGTAPYPSSSGTAPYSRSSGTAPYSRSTGTAPYPSSSGTAPYSRSSGTAPYSSSSGTAPYSRSTGTAPLSSATASSSGTAPVSIKSGSSPISSASGSGFSLPPGSSKVPYPLTNSSAPATSSQPPPTSESSGASSTGGSSLNQPSASETDIVTTETITSYTTVCPFTSTITSGGSQVVTTGLTTSTVFSTKVITICTKCTAKPTPTPVLSGGNSLALSSSIGGSSASTQEVVTTIIIYTTTTTCPVTQTLTSGGITITKSTETVATITSTTTSTICTNCVPPASQAPAFPSQIPSQTASAGGNGGNSPQSSANSPSIAESSSPKVSNGPAPGQNSPTQSNNSPTVPSGSPGQASSNANSPAAGTNPPANVPSNSPASAGGSSKSAVHIIETLTIVPEAVTVTQTNSLAQATQGSQAGFPAPYQAAANGALPPGPSGNTAPLGSNANPTGALGANTAQSSTLAFKGAASKMSSGISSLMIVAFLVVAPLML